MNISDDDIPLVETIPITASIEVFQFSLVVWAVTAAVGVVSNTLMCVTIGCSPSLRTAMNTYVFSIGLVDLLTCALLLPLRMTVETMARDGEYVPKALRSAEQLARTGTDLARLILIPALSMERYQAIARPFSVSKTTARRRAVLVSVAVWLLVLLVSGLALRFFCDSLNLWHCATTGVWGDLELYVELPLTFTAILSIALSYSLILHVLREQRRKMANHSSRPKIKANQVSPLQSKVKVKVKVEQEESASGGRSRRNQPLLSPLFDTQRCVCWCGAPVRFTCGGKVTPRDNTSKKESRSSGSRRLKELRARKVGRL
ncbi:hypothetical protein EGW08_014011 [Elysia chlorotica]|uniref:G-protein coupled receptors family 1 profile domain-containing protein n=1 Tax=Elysia chlorotica TaxID=188477 RepID=A0A3S1BYI9_ELYCH|nr:hypothetical protein EGW08_014011 [Elysia chlorotica]